MGQPKDLKIARAVARPSVSREQRLPALDGLRGVAILLVLVAHFVTDPHSHDPARRLFFGIAGIGWAGVDLFFVLSGFLITGVLLDSKGSPQYFRNFYLRRSLRIFPLYYGVLGGVLLVAALAPRWSRHFAPLVDNQAWLWAYAVNVVQTLRNGWVVESDWLNFAPFWSLSVEEHFYLLWPLAVFLLSRRRLAWACGGLVALAVASRCVLQYVFANPCGVYVFTPCRVDGLAVGALLALAVRGEAAWALRAAGPLAVASAAGVIALFAWQGGTLGGWDPRSQIVGHTLLSVAFGWGVLAAYRGSAVLANPVLRSFGKYSYAIYALQAFAAQPLRAVFSVGRLESLTGHLLPAVFLRLALCGGGLYVLAWLSWHLYEKHFLKLKRFFPT